MGSCKRKYSAVRTAPAHTQHDGAANASVCILSLSRAEADADKDTAAVADHHRHGQRYHRQWKDHRVGGVAIEAQMGGVGNEDLVHNVVQ